MQSSRKIQLDPGKQRGKTWLGFEKKKENKPNYQWLPLCIVLLIYFMFGSDQWAAAHLPFFSLIILCLQTNINHFWPTVCDGIPSVSTKPRPTSDCCSVMDVFDNFKQIFPEKELRVLSQSQFPHSCVCERYMYSHDRSAYSSCRKNVDRSCKSLTDTWMWKLILRPRNSQKRNT